MGWIAAGAATGGHERAVCCNSPALPCPASVLHCRSKISALHLCRSASHGSHPSVPHAYIHIHIHICTYQLLWNMYNNVAALHLCRSVSHGSQSLVSDGALACAWSDIMWAWGSNNNSSSSSGTSSLSFPVESLQPAFCNQLAHKPILDTFSANVS